ncbi:hypothetical protein B0H14DRAFT_3132295 [Mycena olivaceomarginata]|nr:hypothetical protein B0H14DRAFT_3132295 [Mycena olivaceomarginata]
MLRPESINSPKRGRNSASPLSAYTQSRRQRLHFTVAGTIQTIFTPASTLRTPSRRSLPGGGLLRRRRCGGGHRERGGCGRICAEVLEMWVCGELGTRVHASQQCSFRNCRPSNCIRAIQTDFGGPEAV